MVNLKWSPIEDLPSEWESLQIEELKGLSKVWKEQSEKLSQSDSLKKFNERLRREWSIETGIIENLYSIDRGITLLLIEKGIESSLLPHGSTDQPVEWVVSIIKDQEYALEGLFDFVASRRNLSTSYIKELHQLMTNKQTSTEAVDPWGNRIEVPLLKGDWKKFPNNPSRFNGSVHEYCPPEHVASEMDRFLEMHKKHLERNVSPEIEAAWLHHRFTQIHPFQDGNGRLARAIASFVFLRASWFPLVVRRDIRGEYIAALEKADQGSLEPLTFLFAKIQKQEFLKALSLSEEILKEKRSVKQVISSAIEILEKRKHEQTSSYQGVFSLASFLKEKAASEMNEIREALDSQLKLIDPLYSVTLQTSNEETSHWFFQQIISVAKQLDYYADTRTYHAWLRLKIRESRQAEIILSVHSLGSHFVGVFVASAFIFYRERDQEGTTIEGPYPICEEIFQFSYHDRKASVEERFQKWLQNVLLFGIDQWRRQL